MPRARVTRLSMSAPDDTAPISAAITGGEIDPAAIRAIFAKTEGNGCVNDFTRAFAVQSLRLMLGAHLPADAVAEIAMVMSGGTEGALAPHWLVFEALPDDGPGENALAIGVHTTRDLLPEEIGRKAQVELVADGVRTAMARAGIARVEDVHFVQVKCPLITAERTAAAAARGATVATADTLKSMGFSRGAASLGVALALGEIEDVPDGAITTDRSLYSGRASASAGIELMANEIVVLGHAPSWRGPCRIDHAVMEDAADGRALAGIFARTGLSNDAFLSSDARMRVIAVLAKAEPSSTGRLRGHRHTMLDDSDISPTRHARGFVAGVLAGLVGHAEIFVSGGAEHQGPDGGGPLAVIYRAS